MAKMCAACDKKIPLGGSAKTVDGIICKWCSKLSASYMTDDINALREYSSENADRARLFSPKQELKSIAGSKVYIDATNALFALDTKSAADMTGVKVSPLYLLKNPVVFKFDEIVSCESTTVDSVIRGTMSNKPTPIDVLNLTLNTYSGQVTAVIPTSPKGASEFFNKIANDNAQKAKEKTEAANFQRQEAYECQGCGNAVIIRDSFENICEYCGRAV